MMHILGIEPGTPGLKQNVLATKPSLLPMLGLYYITKQDFWYMTDSQFIKFLWGVYSTEGGYFMVEPNYSE